MATLTQCQRVDAWMDTHAGVTIADFDRQPACDGGSKITRLAARIDDLKRQGRRIESRWVTLGNTQVKQYYKVSDLETPDLSSGSQAAAPVPSPLTLASPDLSARPRGRCAIDDDWEAAA